MITRAMLERFCIAIIWIVFIIFGMIVSGMIGKAKSQYNPSNDYFKVGPTGMITVQPPVGSDIKISLGKPNSYVVLKADGTIIYGDDYDPDATAKAFWENLNERRNCK